MHADRPILRWAAAAATVLAPALALGAPEPRSQARWWWTGTPWALAVVALGLVVIWFGLARIRGRRPRRGAHRPPLP